MQDARSLLDKVVSGQEIFGIAVPDHFKRPVFTVFRADVIHDRRAYLGIRIAALVHAENEIAFKLSNTSEADSIALRDCVYIDNILQCLGVILPPVGLESKVKTQIRKVILLLSAGVT